MVWRINEVRLQNLQQAFCKHIASNSGDNIGQYTFLESRMEQ